MPTRLILPAICAGALLWAHPGAAEGALAVGVPRDVAKQGFAYSYNYNKPTADEARTGALQGCRTTKAAPDGAKKLCSIIETFHDKCVAVAMDPLAGTPGVGWAVAADLRTAERVALAKCEAPAGRGRRAACKVDKSNCDGSAK